jgi:hypothetical protein
MTNPSLLIVPDRFKASKLYSQLPQDGSGDFVVTRATTAYRTNAAGILESVANNVPRLDFPIGSGCPALLVEPAATNLVLRSEEFNDASWIKLNAATVTANTSVAPDGTTTADTLTLTTNISSSIYQAITTVSELTFSVYAKVASGTKNFRLRFDRPSAIASANFTATTTWQRFTFTATMTGSGGVYVINDSTGTAGDLIIWGAQLETGSVATSYIPTVAATATRNADVINKTAVSGLIGQTEGTMYAEVDIRNWQTSSRIFAISDNTALNRIMIIMFTSQSLRAVTTAGGVSQFDFTSPSLSNGVYKIAVAYANNDFAFYVNGVQIATSTSALVPACDNVYIGKIETSTSAQFFNDRIRTAALYTTRLSNAQLQSLTTL